MRRARQIRAQGSVDVYISAILGKTRRPRLGVKEGGYCPGSEGARVVGHFRPILPFSMTLLMILKPEKNCLDKKKFQDIGIIRKVRVKVAVSEGKTYI